MYTAKNQYRKLETNVPGKGIARPQSQFLHPCVCERFIYITTIDLPILLQEICGPIPRIYVFIAQRNMNVEIGTEAAKFPEKKIHKWDLICSVNIAYKLYLTLLFL
jgi:hypothetical protein